MAVDRLNSCFNEKQVMLHPDKKRPLTVIKTNNTRSRTMCDVKSKSFCIYLPGPKNITLVRTSFPFFSNINGSNKTSSKDDFKTSKTTKEDTKEITKCTQTQNVQHMVWRLCHSFFAPAAGWPNRCSKFVPRSSIA